MAWSKKEWLMFGGAALVAYFISKKTDAAGGGVATVAQTIAAQNDELAGDSFGALTAAQVVAAQDLAFSSSSDGFSTGPFTSGVVPDGTSVMLDLLQNMPVSTL